MKQLWFQRTFTVDNWPKEAIERLKAFAVDLDAAADFCGQPRGSIVLTGSGAPPITGTGTPPAAPTKPVTAGEICDGLGLPRNGGNIRRIEDTLRASFGEGRHDKDYRLTWDVPPGWTYPQGDVDTAG
jgi:hypothetical protein